MSGRSSSRTALSLLMLAVCAGLCAAWDQSELEMLELVEEVGRNFYEVLDVPQNCTSAEVRKAFRRQSLVVHPDKNDAPDAEAKFRQLVGIYEVLKDEERRIKYDQVLINGLPDWRQPLFYYRRVRKMGTLELVTWVFVLFTVGQYAVAWASYFEKKLTIEEVFTSRLRKLQRKVKKKKRDDLQDVHDVQEEIEQLLQRPSYKNTLPFQCFRLVVNLPQLCRDARTWLAERQRVAEEQRRRAEEERQEMERLREELEKEKDLRRGQRRKRAVPLPDRSDEPDECLLDAGDDPLPPVESVVKAVPKSSGGPWTDDDLVDLAKWIKKYPTGTYERWEKIAEAMNRTVFEVTHFAKKIKDNPYSVRPTEGSSTAGKEGGDETMSANEDVAERVEKKKEKTRGGKALRGLDADADQVGASGASVWTQKQQKALETALAQLPKGSLERWERIAKMVPDKTKEECMMRVKTLAEMVKKKKQMAAEAAQAAGQATEEATEAAAEEEAAEEEEEAAAEEAVAE